MVAHLQPRPAPCRPRPREWSSLRSVFLDFGTVSHDDLDTGSLERVLPGITFHVTSTEAEVDERIAGCEFILTNKLNLTRARMRAVPAKACTTTLAL